MSLQVNQSRVTYRPLPRTRQTWGLFFRQGYSLGSTLPCFLCCSPVYKRILLYFLGVTFTSAGTTAPRSPLSGGAC